jgi:drug/metabolite transporter (DMT)-like permease
VRQITVNAGAAKQTTQDKPHHTSIEHNSFHDLERVLSLSNAETLNNKLATKGAIPPSSRPTSTTQDNHIVCGNFVCTPEPRIEDTESISSIEDGGTFQRYLNNLPFSPRARGLIMLNILVILVSSNWPLLKVMGTTYDPFAFAFLRFSVAALALSPYLTQVFHKDAEPSETKNLLIAGTEIGLYTAAGYLFQSIGLVTTDASRASFISTFTVLIVPILAGLQGRGVSNLNWIASFTALAGVGFLEQSGTSPPGIGDIWSFLSAVAFGVQVYRTEYWTRCMVQENNTNSDSDDNNKNKNSKKKRRDTTMPMMAIVLVTTMLCSGFAAVAANHEAITSLSSDQHSLQTSLHSIPWKEVMYTGILTTDLALLLEIFALKSVPSTDAAIVYTAEPLLGAGLAAYFLGERWGPSGWIGAVMILGSCILTQVYSDDSEGEEKKKIE